MHAKAGLALSLAALMTLAGCFGGADEPATAADSDVTDGLNTESPDGRGVIVAFEETNRTEEGVGGVDHHHDYWQGRERVLIFEQEAKMKPMAAREVAEYQAQATFRPKVDRDDPALIYEGTERVEFTITNPEHHVCEGEDTIDGDYVCTDNWFNVPRVPDPTGGPSGLVLRYKHASTNQWIDVGPIGWGTAVSIAITHPTHTDMPHATSSLWEFQVISPNKQDSTLAFVAKAEIVRAPGEDIPLWPGHPDFYADGPTRVVLDKTGAIMGDAGMYGHGAALVPESAGLLPPDRLVSYGTRTLYVWVNITDVQAPNPATAPNSWFLYHNNATGLENLTDPFDTENSGFDVRQFHYVLPVDDTGMDSPYSDGSRWRFGLGGSLTTPLIACYAQCANWAATYDIKVIASNEELDPTAYHWACLRDEDCAGAPQA